MSEDRSKTPNAAAPYPLSRLSARIDLIDVAREIQAADSVLSAVAGGKLEAIARQIRALQAEAARTLAEAQIDAELHRVRCNFKKIPGKLYHLYERPKPPRSAADRQSEGERYFSLLSPDDWAGKPPHAFLGSFRLEADMRFTAAEQVEAREREWSELRPLLTRGE
ncbi:MAG TPA: DUF2452 domain-containing protein [Polyangiales bacterium]|jgi:hypothetical protein|nr:DUF2452 domain-containing protein [Polyangiales bacterium]